MSIYHLDRYPASTGYSGSLADADSFAVALQRLLEYPAEQLPSCDYDPTPDAGGVMVPLPGGVALCSSQTSDLSILQSMEPEVLLSAPYDDPPAPPSLCSLCVGPPEKLISEYYEAPKGTPIPTGLFPLEQPKVTASSQPPDITDGLGKRQESRDLVSLEDFVVRHAEWLIFENCLCIYRKPCWVKLSSEKDAIREIRRIFQPYPDIRESLTARDYKVLYNGLLSNPSVDTLDVLDSPENCINCLDGVLNLLTMRSRPSSPADHYFHYFNLTLHEVQSPPKYGHYFERFAEQAGDGNPEVRRQILELIALAMTGKQLKVFYAMLGPSNCGKSQVGRFLEELLGRKNVMVVRHIDDFSGSFTVGSLCGKLLGMCLDLPSGTLPQSAVAILKQLVGTDPIKGERKYAHPFMFDVKPLLLLAGNHPIRVANADREEAFFNRLVVIPFSNPVSSSSEVIIDLYKYFLAEAPHIVHEAALAFQALAEQNWEPTRVPVPDEFSRQEGDPKLLAVQSFLENCVVESIGSEVSTSALFSEYGAYAEASGLPMLSEIAFSRALSIVLRRIMPSALPVKRAGNSDARGYSNIEVQRSEFH